LGEELTETNGQVDVLDGLGLEVVVKAMVIVLPGPASSCKSLNQALSPCDAVEDAWQEQLLHAPGSAGKPLSWLLL